MDPLEQYLAAKQQPAGGDPLAAYLETKSQGPMKPSVGGNYLSSPTPGASTADQDLGIDSGMVQPSIKADVLGMAHSPEESSQNRGKRPADPMEADPIAQGVAGGVLGAGGGAALEAGAGAAGFSSGLARLFGLAGEGAINNGTQGGSPVVGGGLGMLLGTGGMLGNAVRQSKGALARDFIEQRGGEVGLTSPGKGPVYDSMDVPGNTAADIGEQASKSGERVEKGLNEYKAEKATRPYLELKSQIPDEVMQRESVPIDDTMSELQAAIRQEQDPVIRSSLRAQLDTMNETATPRYEPAPGTTPKAQALQTLIDDAKDPTSKANLQKLLDKELSSIGPAQGPVRPRMYTEGQANDLRRVLGRKAGIGESNAAAKQTAREQYADLKGKVDSGPLAPANKAFSEGMADYEDSLSKLGLKKNKKPGVNEGNVNKVRIKAQRKGQNNVTAGADRARMDEFTAKHPELGLELDRPELLRKQAELSFRAGAGSHGGLIEATKEASIPAALAIAASGLGHGHAGIAGLLALLAAKNATPIAGRMLYKPAGAAMKAAESDIIPRLLFQAARGGTDQ